VSVNWEVVGKVEVFANSSSSLASGTLTFAPGETLKTISAPVTNPGFYGLIRVALSDPVNAEVTGEAWYFKPLTPNPNVIRRASAGWRYREARSEPPPNWKQLNFDDSSATGLEWLPCILPAGFGVSGVTFGTAVTPGSSTDRTRAFYYRKRFTVASLSEVRSLTFRIRRDDAAAVWLNNEATPSVISADGTFNPPYTYAMSSTTNAVPNSTNTGSYQTFSVPASRLVAGENIIAVEVHQSSLTSSDLIFDCELVADYAPPFELYLIEGGSGPALYWAEPNAILETTTDFGSWSSVPGAFSPLPLDLSVAKKFYRLRK
jgi:hypothetical protein